MTKERFNMLVGSIGAFIGVFVFLAYIPQIIANLHGHLVNHGNHYLQQYPV